MALRSATQQYIGKHNENHLKVKCDSAGGHAWVIDGYIHKSWCFDYYVSNPNYNPNVVYNPEPQLFLSVELKESLICFILIGAGMVIVMVGLLMVVLLQVIATTMMMKPKQINQITILNLV